MKKLFGWLKNFWNRSIQRQLMLGIALVHAVLMTIFVMDLVARQRSFLRTQSLANVEALATTLAANSVSWVLADDVVGLAEVVMSQKNYPNLEYAMILSPRGEVLAHTDNALLGLYVKDPVSLEILECESGVKYLVNDVHLLDIAVPISSGHQHIGWARVAMSQEILHSGLQKILRDGIGYTIIAIIVGSIFAVFMARGITSGIRRLLDVTEKVEQGEIDIHLKDDRTDELGRLGISFNRMIDRVRESIHALESSEKIALAEKEKAQAYMDTAMVVFLVLDLAGQITLINRHGLDVLKYEEHEIMGKNWFDTCVPKPERSAGIRNYKNALPRSDTADSFFESRVITRYGKVLIMEWRNTHLYDDQGNVTGMLWSGIDVTEKKQNEAELERHRHQLEDLVRERTAELEDALDNIKTLKGIVPICSHCKKIRDDQGYWNQLEDYMAKHSDADFSHGICPDCLKKYYPDLDI